jgi:hypothetical protein
MLATVLQDARETTTTSVAARYLQPSENKSHAWFVLGLQGARYALAAALRRQPGQEQAKAKPLRGKSLAARAL